MCCGYKYLTKCQIILYNKIKKNSLLSITSDKYLQQIYQDYLINTQLIQDYHDLQFNINLQGFFDKQNNVYDFDINL